jgi:hypothetical protein
VAAEPKAPVLVILIDDSLSMAQADGYPADKELRAAAEKLAGKTATRLSLAQALLTRSDGGWLATLAGRGYHLRLYHLDSRGGAENLGSISNPSDRDQLRTAIEKVRGLRPHAVATRLGDALRTVLRDCRGRPPAGILLLSDGITTEGESLFRAVRVRRADLPEAPLFGVLLGDPRPRPEVRIGGLDHEDVVTVGDQARIHVQLRASNLTEEVNVRLEVRDQDSGRMVSSQSVRLQPDRLTKARAAFAVTGVGDKSYAVKLTAPADVTVREEDREREVTVRAQEVRPLKVLLVEGGPGFEHRSRYRLLRHTKGVEVRLLLQDADPDALGQWPDLLAELPTAKELPGYDVVLLGDVDPKGPGLGEAALRRLADYVRGGGGLLVQAGPRYTLHALKGTHLADVLSVEITSDRRPAYQDWTDGFRPELTPLGRWHPSFRFSDEPDESAATWNHLPAVYWHAEGYRPRRAAEVLAVHPEAGRAGQPLIVQGYAGSGRSLVLGVNETWRWESRADAKVYGQFWMQTLRYLARRPPARPQLLVDKATAYRLGESIHLTLRLPEEAPAPPDKLPARAPAEPGKETGTRPGWGKLPARLREQLDRLDEPEERPVHVRVEHRPDKGRGLPPTELRLEKVQGQRARFEAVWTARVPGSYRFVLVAPRPDGPAVQATARVLPPPGERELLRADKEKLEAAAELTGGRVYDLRSATRLPDDLPRR